MQEQITVRVLVAVDVTLNYDDDATDVHKKIVSSNVVYGALNGFALDRSYVLDGVVLDAVVNPIASFSEIRASL